MEGQQRAVVPRSISFNPEAATFSPYNASFVVPKDKESKTFAVTNPTAPRVPSEMPQVLTADLPIRAASDKRRTGTGERDGQGGLQSLHPQDMPLDDLRKRIQDHHVSLIQGSMNNPWHGHSPALSTLSRPVRPEPYMHTPPRLEATVSPVGVSDLTTGLGLPGNDQSLMHEYRPSQSIHATLYGKLIGKALDKPLTADTLSEYLKSRNLVAPDVTPLAPGLQGGNVSDSAVAENVPAMKMVPPPPGLGGQPPRMILVENPMPEGRAATDLRNIPTSPATSMRARHDNLDRSPDQHYQQQARRHSHKKRPRAHTRLRRSDQGPEPSAADVYPDDANWMMNSPRCEPIMAATGPSYTPAVPQQVLDASSWPTPAEMCMPKPAVPRVMPKPEAARIMPQPETPRVMPAVIDQYLLYAERYTHKPETLVPFHILENYVKPTREQMKADINDADEDVVALFSELPKVSIRTALSFGDLELRCDTRPLTPGQVNATRYGLEFHSIGFGDKWNASLAVDGQPRSIGDTWDCPAAADKEPFRVRPRSHLGWGGWEWAIGRGWANE